MSRIDDAMERAGLVPRSDRSKPTDIFHPDSEWEIEVAETVTAVVPPPAAPAPPAPGPERRALVKNERRALGSVPVGPQERRATATEVDRRITAPVAGAPAKSQRGGKAPVIRSNVDHAVTEDFPGLSEEVNRQFEGKLLARPGMEFQSVEQFRRLGAMLHVMQENEKIKTVLVSSAVPAEGKTLTACNLALCLSGSYHRRVLLVDADLRRPTIHELLQVPSATGLSEWLRSDSKTGPTIERVSKYLSVLPAGRPDPDPMGILTSPRMQELVRDAADTVDWIILDSPPVGVLSDGHLLSRMADAVILVIRAAHTAHGDVQRAIDSLGRQRIAGVVLNQVQNKGSNRYAYKYGYGDTYGPKPTPPPPNGKSWLSRWFGAS